MVFSITGLGYLLLSIGLGVSAYRCFETAEPKEGGKLAQLYGYFFTIFSLTAFVLGLACLFGNQLNMTRGLLLFKDVLFALGCGTLGYLIIYFKLSKINPWWGFWPIFFVGIISLFIDLLQGHPFITKSGGINWGLSPLGYVLLFSTFLFTFLPMSLILFQQSKFSQDY